MLSNKSFCVTVASAVALVAFVSVMRFLPDFLVWQGWEVCGGGTCSVQSWLSALSGWVAAFGALAAAILTLAPLREQVQEARRQSDFLVGDAAPEFVLLRNRKTDTIKLLVTNWNRRTVMVVDISCIEDTTLSVSTCLTQ
jgi:hypothetical protein